MRRRGVHGDADADAAAAPAKPRFKLETFDLYAKVEKEDRVQTQAGAGVSLVAFAVIALLVFSEVSGWLWPVTREHVTVDAAIEGRVRINFDITLHALRCEDTSLDAMDVAGEQQNGVDHDFTKTRVQGARVLDAPAAGALPSRVPGAAAVAPPAGGALAPLPADYCGPCYGAKADGQCCNSCDDVRAAYSERGWDPGSVVRDAEQCVREGRSGEGGLLGGPRHRAAGAAEVEGCRLRGHLLVNKVAGNFHIAMGETHQRGAGHIHQFNPLAIADYNVSHTINGMSFGEPYPGVVNPLDASTHTPEGGAAVYMYYVKVVPTLFKGGGGRGDLATYQYSVSSQMRPAIVNGQRQNVLPGLFFVYEVTPYLVTVSRERGSFRAFVTGLCAILGGVVTLARLADTLLHKATAALKASGVDVDGVVGGALAAAVSAASAGGASAGKAAGKALAASPLGHLTAKASPMALHSDVVGGGGAGAPAGKSA